LTRPVDILEAAQLVGKTGSIELEGYFKVPVKIENVKQSYGKIRWLVTPIGGSGYRWV
jgi:hypothetical protein